MISLFRKVFRSWFGPPRPRIRVIGSKGPEDVLFEGEEIPVRTMLARIPWEQRQDWRIEKVETER